MKSIKGITEINIYDERTGELMNHVVEENTVTGAVSSVFNSIMNRAAKVADNDISHIADIYKVSSASSGSNTTELAKALFGGLMVFDDSVSTEEGHFIPSSSEMNHFIGCASQSASGVPHDSFSGSLEQVTVTEKYARFQWHFDSTKMVNKKISSLCLTSDCGGRIGFKQDGYDSGVSTIVSTDNQQFRGFVSNGLLYKGVSGSLNEKFGLSKITFPSSGNTAVYKDSGNIVIIKGSTAYVYNLADILVNNVNGLYLGDKFNRKDYVVADASQISLTNTSSNFLYTVDDKAYKIASTQQSGYLNLVEISGVTASETPVDVTITANLKASLEAITGTTLTDANVRAIMQTGCIKQGYLYFLKGLYSNPVQRTDVLKLYRLDLSDSSYEIYSIFDENTPLASDTGFTGPSKDEIKLRLDGTNAWAANTAGKNFDFVNVFDELHLGTVRTSSGVSQHFLYPIDEEEGALTIPKYPRYFVGTQLFMDNFISNIYVDDWCAAPYIALDFYKMSSSTLMISPIELFAPYLATVNNLSETPTKLAGYYMTVIYTLQNN